MYLRMHCPVKFLEPSRRASGLLNTAMTPDGGKGGLNPCARELCCHCEVSSLPLFSPWRPLTTPVAYDERLVSCMLLPIQWHHHFAVPPSGHRFGKPCRRAPTCCCAQSASFHGLWPGWIQEPFTVEPPRDNSGLILGKLIRSSSPKIRVTRQRSELQANLRRYSLAEPRNPNRIAQNRHPNGASVFLQKRA